MRLGLTKDVVQVFSEVDIIAVLLTRCLLDKKKDPTVPPKAK